MNNMDSTPSNGNGVSTRWAQANTGTPQRDAAGQTQTMTREGGATQQASQAPRQASASRPPAFDSYPAIAIENVEPEIEGGRWPIKRAVGDTVAVAAEIFKEAHDVLQARAVWRPADAREWQEAPMRPTENDRWTGSFTVDRNTRYVYGVLAFTDVYGSWRADFQKRLAAAQDVRSELLEGLRLVEDAAQRCTDASERGRLHAYADRWRSSEARDAAELAISQELSEVMDRWPDR